ncbi:hypothetical protein B8W99_13225 [Peribacillus simplex]|nr:hypothetical protein B8W99_13225 [Peribacillus simplex]
MFPLRSESIHKAWKEPIFLTKKALFVKIVIFKTKLFKVDWSGSARLLREQRDRETPQAFTATKDVKTAYKKRTVHT